mmetsp:Transcript_33002/g.96319  ORF Transcript_33002/g.96319 Transcript_33002/m.96319 type:complete len:227 (+) Transcript_33002:250-930(+)
MRLIVNHLGREVIERAAEGLPQVAMRELLTPSEVGELRHATVKQEDVLGLDVTVDNIERVQVVQGAGHLREDRGGLGVRELPSSAERPEERAARCVLKQQADAAAVLEAVQEPEDVRMPQLRLRPRLPLEVLSHAVLRYELLRDDLHRVHGASPLVGDLPDRPVGAAADLAGVGKVVRRESHHAFGPPGAGLVLGRLRAAARRRAGVAGHGKGRRGQAVGGAAVAD